MLNRFIQAFSVNRYSSLFKNALWGLLVAALLVGAGALCYERGQAVSTTSSPRAIGAVNITRVVNEYVKSHAEQGLSPEAQAKAIRAFGQQLENQLKQLAEEEHVVLLPSEAVIAGARDYTSALQARLKTANEGTH